jgi:hypothetical protein
MLVVAYANQDNKYKDNFISSMEKWGYKYAVVGKDEKWVNFMTRIRSIRDYLKTVDDPYIVSMDCYDAFACKPSDNLLQEFLQLHVDIVFSGEFHCLKNCYPVERWRSRYYAYPNGGFYLGKREKIISMLDYFLATGLEDDQVAMGQYADKNPHNYKLHLDNGQFCLNILFYQSFNKDKSPYFIHTPGRSTDYGHRYNSLGYQFIPNFKPEVNTKPLIYLLIFLFLSFFIPYIRPITLLLIILCYIYYK